MTRPLALDCACRRRRWWRSRSESCPVRPRGGSASCLTDCLHCRVPPRQAGNFHLRGQMKVTKAKALNATPFTRTARAGAANRRAAWRACGTSNPQRARRRGPRKASPARIRWTPGRRKARPRRACCWLDPRQSVKVARRAGPAKREERAEWCCIQPLCFGDFHVGPQMKVTRPPGRDPAGWQTTEQRVARRDQRTHRTTQ